MLNRPLARALAAAAIVLASLGAAEASRQGKAERHAMSDRECLARAMYFESNRTAEDGMLAVGTIVMNRLTSGRYGASLCRVVAQYAQFAPGVLSRTMAEKRPSELALKVADAVLEGHRHPLAGDVMFFHTANVPFRNDDKHYVLVSGGNAFYRWNRSGDDEVERANLWSLEHAFEEADEAREVGRKIVAEASEPPRRIVAAQTPEGRPAEPGEIRVAMPLPRVEDMMATRPDTLTQALGYRSVSNERTPAASAALAIVMTLGRRPRKPSLEAKSPRVISVAEPVLASSAPSFLSRATESDPLANMIVATAWSVFR